jgi:hypothetical protein
MKELNLEQMERVEGGTCLAGMGIAMSTGMFGYAAAFGPFALALVVAGSCIAGEIASS